MHSHIVACLHSIRVLVYIVARVPFGSLFDLELFVRLVESIEIVVFIIDQNADAFANDSHCFNNLFLDQIQRHG